MTAYVLRSALLSLGLVLLALAAVQDLRIRIIPNGVVISVAVTGLLLGATGRPLSLWINIAVGLVLLGVFGVVSHFELIGGGDVKLLAAVTLLVPPEQIAGLLLAIALVGGLVSAVYLLLYRFLKHRAADHVRWDNALAHWWRRERSRIRNARTVPYALAISGGSIVYIIAEWHRCWSATSCSL